MAEEVDVLADRPGWTVEGTVAVYAPHPGGWRGRVQKPRISERSYERYHLAIIDPAGVARYTTFASSVAEAVRVTEAHVRAKPSTD